MRYLLVVSVLLSGGFLAMTQPPTPRVKQKHKETIKDSDDYKPSGKPPVPVFGGKNNSSEAKRNNVEATKDDTLPASTDDDGGAALMPLAFVKNRLDNLKSGNGVYISIEAVKVDAKRRCYLDPNALFGSSSSDRPILVKRTGAGYHIVLDKIEHQWIAKELPGNANWITIKSVEVKQ